jgi:catechol 2,3-dioxygenase-like lactoylglutathione lyase family enzyme
MSAPVGPKSGASLGLISLIVPDYDEAIAFFCDALAFHLIDDIDHGTKRWVTVQPPGGGCRIVLAQSEGPAQRAAIGNQGAGRVWLFLQTDDFVRDHAAMRAKGIAFEEEPRHEPYGTVAVWRDIFGNRWDLVQFSP